MSDNKGNQNKGNQNKGNQNKDGQKDNQKKDGKQFEKVQQRAEKAETELKAEKEKQKEEERKKRGPTFNLQTYDTQLHVGTSFDAETLRDIENKIRKSFEEINNLGAQINASTGLETGKFMIKSRLDTIKANQQRLFEERTIFDTSTSNIISEAERIQSDLSRKLLSMEKLMLEIVNLRKYMEALLIGSQQENTRLLDLAHASGATTYSIKGNRCINPPHMINGRYYCATNSDITRSVGITDWLKSAVLKRHQVYNYVEEEVSASDYANYLSKQATYKTLHGNPNRFVTSLYERLTDTSVAQGTELAIIKTGISIDIVIRLGGDRVDRQRIELPLGTIVIVSSSIQSLASGPTAQSKIPVTVKDPSYNPALAEKLQYYGENVLIPAQTLFLSPEALAKNLV